MKKLYLALCLGAIPALSMADHPIPPVPEGGINYTIQGECQDNETGDTGYCYGGYTVDGRFVLTFWQNDELMFIREVKPGGQYETIWISHLYNAI